MHLRFRLGPARESREPVLIFGRMLHPFTVLLRLLNELPNILGFSHLRDEEEGLAKVFRTHPSISQGKETRDLFIDHRSAVWKGVQGLHRRPTGEEVRSRSVI